MGSSTSASEPRVAARVAAAAASACALGVVGVPAVADVPWYANAALSCALSAGVGLFAWGVAFVSETKRRLALIERAIGERSNER